MMQWLLARLRTRIFTESPYDDTAILGILNDGYQSACERSMVLRSWTTLALGAGLSTVNLPADWAATIGVYRDSAQMEYLPVWEEPGRTGAFYFDTATRTLAFGDAGASPGGTSVILHYARTPTRLGLTDTPEPAFGREWWYMLRHYAAWRLYLYQGGAQDLAAAQYERQSFETAVEGLRRSANADASGVARLRTIQEVPV